jgi:hypothetical protein
MADTCSLLPYAAIDGRCDLCGTTLTGRQKRWHSKGCQTEWMRNHKWSWARKERKRIDRYCCTWVRCDEREHLEVNHIDPRVGRGYGFGCWNHQENLETLCHTHHVMVTALQRALRKQDRND